MPDEARGPEPCQHDHATCDDCGMGFTALTAPALPAPVAGADEVLRERLLAIFDKHFDIGDYGSGSADPEAAADDVLTILHDARERGLDVDALVVGISEAVKRVCLAHGIRPTEFLDAIRAEYRAALSDRVPGETP